MSKVDQVMEALDRHPEIRDEVKERLAQPDPDWKPDHTDVATTRGKEYALQCLAWRRANKPKQIDNASLYAGSPMYFYCRSCGHLSDTKPESYFTPVKKTCNECEALQALGWLE